MYEYFLLNNSIVLNCKLRKGYYITNTSVRTSPFDNLNCPFPSGKDIFLIYIYRSFVDLNLQFDLFHTKSIYTSCLQIKRICFLKILSFKMYLHSFGKCLFSLCFPVICILLYKVSCSFHHVQFL